MDLIDRQAALDAFDKQYWNLLDIPICKEIRDAAKRTIKALPAVQPEPKPDKNGSEPFGNAEMLSDRTTDDCISRQAAIDAVGFYSLHSGDKLLFADKPLKDLPSAQSEQTKMIIKEIRKWINSGNRGSADYFIVDKIEEIINKYE